MMRKIAKADIVLGILLLLAGVFLLSSKGIFAMLLIVVGAGSIFTGTTYLRKAK